MLAAYHVIEKYMDDKSTVRRLQLLHVASDMEMMHMHAQIAYIVFGMGVICARANML